MIVQNTEVFVFVLSAGIFSSEWCLKELKTAIKYGKQVISFWQ
jgi:hypothetical protein